MNLFKTNNIIMDFICKGMDPHSVTILHTLLCIFLSDLNYNLRVFAITSFFVYCLYPIIETHNIRFCNISALLK